MTSISSLSNLELFTELDSKPTQPQEERIIEVEIEKIVVNPDQPRRIFSHEELDELAESLKSVGLIHPPTVRLIDDGDRFEIISGERRFRAAKLAGFKKILVHVRSTSKCLSAQAALIENVQRVDLNPLEIALSLQSLIHQFGFTQEQLARQIGKKRSTVANYLRLLTLPKAIQETISSGEISMGHAKVILSLEGTQKQFQLYEKIVQDNLSVRQTEDAAAKIVQQNNQQTFGFHKNDVHLEDIIQRLQEKFGTKVNIQGNTKKGRISIEYF
jgi:ParB family chromosome partitioning protein